MGLKDEAEKVSEEESDLHRTRAALDRVRHEAAGLRRTIERQAKEIDEQAALLDRFAYVKAEDTKTPKWMKTPRKKRREHHATPILMLSDLHLDEVVDLEEMDGVNEYSRAIAERRLTRTVEGAITLLKHYVAGVTVDGVLVALLGDIITGAIHDELVATNEAPPAASIAYWVPVLASALVFLADELDVPVHVAPVDGNHDRFYKKTPAKQRAESSLAWVIYNWLADHVRGDDRISFSITVAPEQLVDVYDTTFLLSHGDSFRSAGGVGGLYPSMLKWLLRRHDYYSKTSRDFDFALIGHWHSTLWHTDCFVNGSLKGYDEYARRNGFSWERPQQQLFIVTPERGVTTRMSVHAE